MHGSKRREPSTKIQCYTLADLYNFEQFFYQIQTKGHFSTGATHTLAHDRPARIVPVVFAGRWIVSQRHYRTDDIARWAAST
jgi:hypothetical protein